MTTFVYKAKKPTAETVTGQIHASSQDEAIDLISNLGLLPVKVEALLENQNTSALRFAKIKGKDIYVLSRQLANLIKSGVGLLRSLMIIEEQTQNPKLKIVLSKMAQGIKNGRTFSDCLKDYPNVFSYLFVTMVRAGEESGRLQEMLVNVSLYQQKQEEMLSKIRTALAYPVFMAFVGILTVYFILTFTLPKMSSLFDNMGQNLPIATQVLLQISRTLTKFWYVFLIGIIGLAIFIERYRKTIKGQQFISAFVLKIPMVGEVLLKSDLARFSRTVVLLLKGGVSIVQALEVAVPVIKNKVIRDEMAQCKLKLVAGGTLGESLRDSKQIPQMMGHLISIGEESGNISDILQELTDVYEQETEEKLKFFTTLFEPMMILIIGSMIGFIVFAMLLPIFQFDVLAK